MSITIRLSRTGKRNAPSYKMVVANTKDKRDGRYLDILGYYNPSHTPELFEYDQKKFTEWVNKGAMVTDAVDKLTKGEYEHIPYNPNPDTQEEQEEPAEE